MAFVVITGNDRKVVDTIRQAMEYVTDGSRIYEMDAFGNLAPMNNEQVNEQLSREPPARQVSASVPEAAPVQPVPAQDPNKPINVTVNLQQPAAPILKEPEKPVRKDDGSFVKLVKYMLYFLLLTTFIVFAYYVLLPFFKEIGGLMDMSAFS